MTSFASLSPGAIQGVLQGMNAGGGAPAQPQPAPGAQPSIPPTGAMQPPNPAMSGMPGGGSFFGSRPAAAPAQQPRGMYAQPLPTIDPTTGQPIGPNGAGPSGQPSSLYQALMLTLFGNGRPQPATIGAAR